MHMATEHPAPPTRPEIYTDLYETLAVARHAEHARHMVEALLRERRTGRQLVGLVENHQRAVFYSPVGRTLVAYRFDRHGLCESDHDTLWRLLGDAASWVDAHRDDLDWVHPHFRWVLDVEEDVAWGYPPGSDHATADAHPPRASRGPPDSPE
jgi:hypothetical protein